MSRTRRKHTAEFKEEAIRLYEASDKSMTEIKRNLGIAPGLLNKWRARQRADGKAAFPSSGHQTEAEAELRRLERENDLLREERDILLLRLQLWCAFSLPA